MTLIKCGKCGTESEGKFCSNCGGSLVPERVRSVEQITKMQEYLDKALKLRGRKNKEGGVMFELIMGLFIKITLDWVKGGKTNPVEMVLGGEEMERSEEAKALIELSKMYN